MNFSVLHFFKFASRIPQIAQILVLTFKIFGMAEEGGGGRKWGGGKGVGGGGGKGVGGEGGAYPRTTLEISFLFSLAIPGSNRNISYSCQSVKCVCTMKVEGNICTA